MQLFIHGIGGNKKGTFSILFYIHEIHVGESKSLALMFNVAPD